LVDTVGVVGDDLAADLRVGEESADAEVVGADPHGEDGVVICDGGLEEGLGSVDAVGGFVSDEGRHFVFQHGRKQETGLEISVLSEKS
jgi:hypothetical protein